MMDRRVFVIWGSGQKEKKKKTQTIQSLGARGLVWSQVKIEIIELLGIVTA